MKKKDYIPAAIFLALIITGIIIGHFWGGFITGISGSLLLFVTLGKYLFRKAEKRTDAAIAMSRALYQEGNE